MNATTDLQTIIANLTAALPDAEKFDKGNKAAGARIRAAAQAGKVALQTFRVNVQAAKTAAAAE